MLIAAGEFAVIAVCLWLMRVEHVGPVGAWDPAALIRPKREAARLDVLKEGPKAGADDGEGEMNEADADAMWRRMESMSFDDYKAAIAGEKDAASRERLLGFLVANQGTARPEEVYGYLQAHQPPDEARVPLLHLGIDNVTNNEKVFQSVLRDVAPSKNRTSLLYEALRFYPPAKLVDFFKDLETAGFKEDGEQIAYLISNGNLGRSDITEEMLVDMMGRVGSRKIGESVADEMIRRKADLLLGNPESGKIPDIAALTAGVPEGYRNYFAKTYYDRVMPVAVGHKHGYADLVAKGVPQESLAPYVKDLVATRVREAGPLEAIAGSGDMRGEARTVYVKAVMADWVGYDSVGAGRAMDEVPEGGDRDLMLGELVRHHRERGDQAAAAEWAARISSRPMREKLEERPAGEGEREE
ncbi:hypothetical protein JIN84_05630 [Luteolibacter yonseiensis]|uniref:Uncharacterized protein n=1 Tax=Luteolibacter yonseiensis TaxID=1144680 RepID=A0A934R1A4_9BACT|nr:hypothetical protein [Luteolibacter yonseiensis]MBK1815081.1 hypothetical protein [Luteolibacter yonseiensis]